MQQVQVQIWRSAVGLGEFLVIYLETKKQNMTSSANEKNCYIVYQSIPLPQTTGK